MDKRRKLVTKAENCTDAGGDQPRARRPSKFRPRRPTAQQLVDARERLHKAGKTIAQFARENDLSAKSVYAVLDGSKKGNYGDAHRAAVLLGLKEGIVQQTAGAQR